MSLFQKKEAPVTFTSLLATITSVAALITAFTEKETVGTTETRKVSNASQYSLGSSLNSGLFGGLIGGTLSGVVMAVVTYKTQIDPSFQICLGIIPYCALIGCLFGGLIYLLRRIFISYISSGLLGDFLGCLCGSLIAGLFSGLLGMWLFGRYEREFLGINLIVIASVVACFFLILGTLIYDYEGKVTYVIRSMVIAVVITSFISMLAFLIFGNDKIATFLNARIYTDNQGDLLMAGLVLGTVNGLVFGLIIGLTLVIFKYLKFTDKQMAVLARSKA